MSQHADESRKSGHVTRRVFSHSPRPVWPTALRHERASYKWFPKIRTSSTAHPSVFDYCINIENT